jgi:hypothetical protein
MTTPLSNIEHKSVALLMLAAVLVFSFPESSLAARPALSGNSSLVFELKENALSQNQNTTLTYEQLSKADPLVVKVRSYLETKGSPLSVHAEDIIKQPNWQRALAVSFVESNFGKRCADNNCSGIGVAPGHPSWRKYPNKLAWFVDLNVLLDKPLYKERANTCAKMRGVYVVPGSSRWVYGCSKVEQELNAITTQAEQERSAVSQVKNVLAFANTNSTFTE